jgi:hypothetical protein
MFRALRSAALAVLFASSIALALCWHTGIWSWHDYEVYREMSKECHPVWRDLWAGRIKEGDALNEVTLRTLPARIERFRRFARLSYYQGMSFTGITVIAKDEKLITAGAWSCCWNVVFFDRMSPDDNREFLAAFEAHHGPIREARIRSEFVAAVTVPGLVASVTGPIQFSSCVALLPD